MECNQRMKYRLDALLSTVRTLCHDQSALEEAKNLVPIAQIVQDNLDVLEGDYQEKMLPYLTEWFANEFFNWFKTPACESCGRNLDGIGSSLNVEGKTVEHYKCNGQNQNGSCQFTYDFIRHNDPSILLVTRRGRCGEWANCFFVFLKAFDYDARIVFDSTDHVWNEVWSEPKQRWVHVDPCENSIDNPLLYEAGWSKELEYCIAFGPYESLDVTRRYSIDFEGTTKSRRKSCDETWLEEYLNMLTCKLLESAPSNIKETVLKRHAMDKQLMIELATTNILKASDSAANGNNLSGRKSGSMAWRIERGEYCPILKKSHVIKVTCDNLATNEIRTGEESSYSAKGKDDDSSMFDLRYNSIGDCYTSSLTNTNCSKGWSSLIFLSENLDYKYERDWRTAYIARYETCPSVNEGKIVWRFDLSGLKGWKKVDIRVDCKIYPMTTVDLQLILYNESNITLESINLEINQLNTISESIQSDLGVIHFLELVAKLKGGDPNDQVAWQKPQLFRRTRNVDDDQWPLIFKVS